MQNFDASDDDANQIGPWAHMQNKDATDILPVTGHEIRRASRPQEPTAGPLAGLTFCIVP